MASAQNRLLGVLFVSGLLSCGLAACSSDSDNGSGSTGGSGGSGSGSASSAGGGSSSVASSSNAGSSGGGQSSSSSSSKGGASGGSSSSQPASSGGVATGGSSSSEVASSGGSTSTSTGTGGKGGGTGTDTGTGGKGGGTGGATTGGKGGTSAVTTGGTGGASSTTPNSGSGTCQKGQVKGKEVVIFGESFYDFDPHYIQLRIEENAKKAGALGSSETYRNVSSSGQPMSYIAGTEYDNAVKGGTFKAVIMDGGGIDCMNSSCPTCPDLFKGMLDKFVKQGVGQVIYTRYPEPGNPPGSNANLKKNLDALMPKMEEVCKAATGLKCYWVDLRPLWPAEKDKYTTDGLHPTKTGGDVVGDAIWAEMVKQCMAQ